MAGRRAGWLVVAVIIVLIGSAGLVGMAVLFDLRKSGSDNLADWLSLGLAFLVAMVTLLVWVVRRVHVDRYEQHITVRGRREWRVLEQLAAFVRQHYWTIRPIRSIIWARSK